MTGLLPRRTLPVLMYHRIGIAADDDPNLWITEERFASQLRWLAESGFRTLSLHQAYDCWRSRHAPRRCVLLTIDDGFAETVASASTVLQQLDMQAALFVPAGLLGRQVELRHPRASVATSTAGRLVNGAELRAWSDLGFDVGSHSLSHEDLRGCPAAETRRQVRESKQRLEEVISRPVDDFCYPFARHDAAARQEVAAAGYRAAYAGEPPIPDLYALPRVMVYPQDTPERFARKVSGYYYWLSAWHQRWLRLAASTKPSSA